MSNRVMIGSPWSNILREGRHLCNSPGKYLTSMDEQHLQVNVSYFTFHAQRPVKAWNSDRVGLPRRCDTGWIPHRASSGSTASPRSPQEASAWRSPRSRSPKPSADPTNTPWDFSASHLRNLPTAAVQDRLIERVRFLFGALMLVNVLHKKKVCWKCQTLFFFSIPTESESCS